MLRRCAGKWRPQYWQICPSRASTLRRLRWSFCFGKRSNCNNRITRGTWISKLTDRIQSSSACLSSARKLARFPPGIEGIGGELPIFGMNHFGQLAAEQPERPPHVDDMNGHVKPIEHQHATGQRGAGGGMTRLGAAGAPDAARRHVAGHWPEKGEPRRLKPFHVAEFSRCMAAIVRHCGAHFRHSNRLRRRLPIPRRICDLAGSAPKAILRRAARGACLLHGPLRFAERAGGIPRKSAKPVLPPGQPSH